MAAAKTSTDQPSRPTTVAQWQAHQADLRGKIAAAGARIAGLEAERGKLVLAASLADPAAQERVRATRHQITTARLEVDEAEAAIEAAEAEIAAIRSAEVAAERRRRCAEIDRLRRERIDIIRGVDDAMSALAEALARRSANSAEMSRLGAFATDTAQRRASSRTALVAALHFSGAAKFLPVDRMSASTWNPLSETEAYVLGAAKDAAAALLDGRDPRAEREAA